MQYLAILINNMSLLLNPEFIYITSEIYSKINNSQDILQSYLTSENMVLDNLNILDYSVDTLLLGK